MVMLTPEEKERVKQAAEVRGMLMSAYCRMVLLGSPDKSGGEDDA